MAGPAAPLRFASPWGVLHFIPEEKESIQHFSESHRGHQNDLRNQYVREALRSGRHSGTVLGGPNLTKKQETDGWQVPELAGYLLHEHGFIIAVVGNSGKFHDARAEQLMLPPEAAQALLDFTSKQHFRRTVGGQEELHGFRRLQTRPAWVDTLEPEGTCGICGLPIAYLHGRDLHGRR